jgi:hypothetical protein
MIQVECPTIAITFSGRCFNQARNFSVRSIMTSKKERKKKKCLIYEF